MKEYTAIIKYFNGDEVEFKTTEEEAKKYGNINNLIFRDYNQYDIEKIKVALWNEYTQKYFYETTYESYLERLKNNENRVEITYTFDEGEEEIFRCYIGKSTGWIPIYLEIKRCDSNGGGGLLVDCITNIKIIR